MKRILITTLLASAALNFSQAGVLDNDGPIRANGSNGQMNANKQITAGTFVTVGTSISAGSSVAAGTSISAGSYFTSPGYLTVAGAGYFGDFLRIGGAANTPASKAVQIGQYAATSSFNSLVVGRYNLDKAKDSVTAPNAAVWNDNDPLFVVANGTGAAGADQYRNAFTVYKDGTVTMSKVQGDIGMGQFGN